MKNYYATVEWHESDVRDKAPQLPAKKAEEFLKRNENCIRDRMTEAGWNVIEELLGQEDLLPVEQEHLEEGSP